MPDKPGALHRAAEAVKKHSGNISRISYDRNIDPETVFFEVCASKENEEAITRKLDALGFLQTALHKSSFLKFNIYLPNRPGALFEFLNYTTNARANIAFLDFDEKKQDRLTVSLTIDDRTLIDGLLDELKGRYRLEVLEYDASGSRLDDTVFYVRFAQQLRAILGGAEDDFLLKLLQDTNRIVQELTRAGQDPRTVFESIVLSGKTLKETTGENFYADIQRIKTGNFEVISIQPPAGGNVYLIDSPDETVMIDTGYGIYHDDIQKIIRSRLKINPDKIKKIFISHADADHAGGSGYYNAEMYTHEGTEEIIERSNRAYGSKTADSILTEVYTKLINLFSGFNPAKKFKTYKTKTKEKIGPFPVLDRVRIAGTEFLVLESLGGHLHAQIFLLSQKPAVLFAADTLINFESLTEERKKYNLHAKNLMTTVNVDSTRAITERKDLLDVAQNLAGCIICGGHGTISKLKNGRLETTGEIEKYLSGS